MANLTVSNDIDTFMASVNAAAARAALGVTYSDDINDFLQAADNAAAQLSLGVGLVNDGSTRLAPRLPLVLNGATGNEVGLTLPYTVNKATSGDVTGLLIDAIETAVPGAHNPFQVKVGGAGKFSVDKNGAVKVSDGTTGFAFHNDSGGMLATGYYVGTRYFRMAYNALTMDNGMSLGWGNTATLPDLSLFRDAAGALALRNGTNAQTFRAYNTYTNSSNYERGVFDWQTTANTLTIGTQAAGTGTARDVSIVTSATALVKGTAFTGSTYGLVIPGAWNLSWGTWGSGNFVTLQSPGADVLELRSNIGGTRGGSSLDQTFRVYGTSASSASYVRASLKSTATAVILAAESEGAGAADLPLVLSPKGTGAVEIDRTTLDSPFFNFKATADADATSAISTLTTSGSTTHHIQIEMNGTKAWIAASTTDPS